MNWSKYCVNTWDQDFVVDPTRISSAQVHYRAQFMAFGEQSDVTVTKLPACHCITGNLGLEFFQHIALQTQHGALAHKSPNIMTKVKDFVTMTV